MKVFGSYARYYDLLYKDKGYSEEARFIHNLLQNYVPEAHSILDLGCGTGVHAAYLAAAGYTVHGVDLSTDMLERATKHLAEMPPAQASRLTFSQGDIRTVRLNGSFDVIISLFHVMSYQTTNEDLQRAFDTAKVHLMPGGVFIFDCWYGPAVLSDRPVTRVKYLENEVIRVTRIAEPLMHANTNLVDVNYHVLIEDKQSGNFEDVKETHHMRYLFKPEIELLFDKNGFELLECGEWMMDKKLGFDTWYVYFVAKK